MPRVQWWTVAAFVGWTVTLWTSRIPNALTNSDLTGLEQLLRLGVATVFLSLGCSLAAVHWQARWWPLGFARAGLLRVVAALTVGYWGVRALGLFYRGYNFTFTSSHMAMGTVSILLALVALALSLPTRPVPEPRHRANKSSSSSPSSSHRQMA